MNFTSVASRLLANAQSLLSEWFPEGTLSGHEFRVGDLQGSLGKSLSVNIMTGAWSDFATGQAGGDLISLYAAIYSIKQSEAVKRLTNGGSGDDSASPVRARQAAPRIGWTPIVPIPEGTPAPPDDYYRKIGGDWTKLKFIKRWTYTDSDGRVCGHVCRFETYDIDGVMHKDVLPQTWCKGSDGTFSWRWKSMPMPRPIYNVTDLSGRANAPVMIVEGEKCAEAVRILAPQYVPIAWAGGAAAWRKTDWQSLRGRQVVLWPDADKPGAKTMWELGHALLRVCESVKIIIPDDDRLPEGWDAADAVRDGWDWQRLKAWALPRVKLLEKKERAEIAGDVGQANGVAMRTDIAAEGSGGNTETASDFAGQGDEADRVGKRTLPGSQIRCWEAWGLERSGKGLPVPNLDNAVRVMEGDARLKGLVWYDTFLGRCMTGAPAREWTDADDANLVLHMQRAVGIVMMGPIAVRSAVMIMSHREERNCVRQWLGAIAWDQKPRIEGSLAQIFGCEVNDYSRAVSRNFWVSMVARIYQPGCKVDNMVVLEGAQGTYKSTALSIIGGNWYAEQHESATNAKAFAEILQGKLLIEISEMDAFTRAEVTRVKQVISCQTDRYRDSYGYRATDHPRQCVMVGSTNKDDWNRDETGARRFWPIACKGRADIAWLRLWREQLFVEGLLAYRAGEAWHAIPGADAEREQSKRFDGDPWLDPISQWVSSRTYTTVVEICLHCLDLKIGEVDRSRQMRVATSLRALGWTNTGNVRRGKQVVKLWIAPGSDLLEIKHEVATEVATEKDIPFQ